MSVPHPYIILFDGQCNLCNRSVQFILRHDKLQRFKFASLQSEAGQKLCVHWVEKKHQALPDSILLMVNHQMRTESTAVLYIARFLGLPWSLLYPLIIIPAPLRNYIYRIIAQNRYRWFGQSDECMVPRAELASRFLG